MASDSVRALGLMSGTSMDGIDAAILQSDGCEITAFGPTHYKAYSHEDRVLLRRAMDEARDLTSREARPGALHDAETLVTERHIAIVRQVLAEAGPVDLIGFHGQTLFHAPDRGLTVQIGDGQKLADAIGTPVVYDLRANDVANGGQGAPLVPVYHRALAMHLGIEPPLAIVNIGGVAKATWIGCDGDLAACDTGPGNALMNDWVKQHTGADFDADGSLARNGTIDAKVLSVLLDHPYFALDWPKSLDRDAFSLSPLSGLDLADGVATLAAFTVKTLADGLRGFGQVPTKVVVCGGGTRNPVLMEMLAKELSVPVMTMDSYGVQADFIEAQAFAFCAIRSANGLAVTFPGTTGVSVPLSGGKLVSPRK